jgi:glycosyltransferase involved in cell wall biosynthesis
MVFGTHDGGVAEYAGQVASALPSHGIDVEVAGPLDALPYDRLAAAGVPIHRLPLEYGFPNPIKDSRALAGLLSLCRSGRFDLVHCLSVRAGALGRAAAFVSRIPVVYSPHCYFFVGQSSVARRLVGVLLERLLANVTRLTICVCEDERRVALDHRIAPPERLTVVHNGSPACHDTEVDPVLGALAGEGPLAVAITSLREQKALHVLIEATPRILADMPEARVAIVGNGPLEARLGERAAALGLDRDRRFRMLGFRGPAARYLRAADVYVLPSAWEAFPIGVLEALACGVPQIATDVGGTREAVSGETGVLVPAGDADGIAAAVVALLRDEGRRARMAEASLARHAEAFTLSAMVEATVAAYRRVLDPVEADPPTPVLNA